MIKKEKAKKKQPLQRRSRETKKAILQASAQILSQDGFSALNTNRVAQKAGVSVGSLYQYFTDKEAIVKDLTIAHFDSRNQSILEMLGDDLLELPTREAIRRVLKAAFQSPVTETLVDQAIIRQALQDTSPERLKEQDAILIPAFRAFVEMKPEFNKKKNLELSLYVIIQSLRGLIAASVMSPRTPVEADELIEETTAMIVCYLGNQDES